MQSHSTARRMSAPATFLLVLVIAATSAFARERPRLAILTDIGGDPDDVQSMIRLLVYANEFDLELLMATAVRVKHAKEGPTTRPHIIRELVEAYGKVLPNLREHAAGWPAVDQLHAITHSGNPRYGRKAVGAGHDTAGSRVLVERIDAGSAARPLNISLWGGQTDLAQALWRVKHDRGASGLAEFVRKMRVLDVNDQDEIADWMRVEFPGMFYILAKKRVASDGKVIEGTYRGMYVTGDISTTSRAWVDENILSRGPLGTLYPTKTWTVPNPHSCLKEGDTFSWFFFLPLGGNDPSDPTKPGWGGRYQKEADGWYADLTPSPTVDPRLTVSQWRTDFQRDFAKRMRWCQPNTASALP